MKLHKSCNIHDQLNYINLIYVAIDRETSFNSFPALAKKRLRLESTCYNLITSQYDFWYTHLRYDWQDNMLKPTIFTTLPLAMFRFISFFFTFSMASNIAFNQKIIKRCLQQWNEMETRPELCFHFREMCLRCRRRKKVDTILSLKSLPLSHTEQKAKRQQVVNSFFLLIYKVFCVINLHVTACDTAGLLSRSRSCRIQASLFLVWTADLSIKTLMSLN